MDVRGVEDKIENIKSTSSAGNAVEYIDWIEKSLKNAKDIVEIIEKQIPEKVKRRQILYDFNDKPYRLREIVLDVGR